MAGGAIRGAGPTSPVLAGIGRMDSDGNPVYDHPIYGDGAKIGP